MSCVPQSEAKDMTSEQIAEYCKWCFYQDFGDCDFCALYHGVIKECNRGKKGLRGEGR